MADTAIEFLIEKLKQQLIRHAHLIRGAADYEVEKQFRHLKTLVRDVPRQSRDDEEQLIRRIRNAVYVAEDTIDAYVTRKNLFQGPPNIVTIVEQIEAALENIGCVKSEEMRTNFADTVVQDGGTTEELEERPVKESNRVVGIKDEAEKMFNYLLKESAELQVFSIIGMPGTGKTVLAHQIFLDPNIAFEFPTRIWVYVSQDFTAKEIFLDILKEFTILSDDVKRKNDKELADLVVSFLENQRFLLVMDDLWSPEDWDTLKVALPMSNKMGRVLITSRVNKVGWHVNRHEGPHTMRFLYPDESLELLAWEAFGQPWLPPELEDKGILIARECGGHPLSIVLIAGILVKEFSTDVLTMKTTLENVHVELSHYSNEVEDFTRIKKIIMLSYRRLPYNLRESFLYFGMFPEDFEIPVWKLIRLWIAEGFIKENVDVSLEEIAENYLEELIDRKLVRGVKFKLHGKVKACRVHDFILHFCIDEAAREGFFKQIKMGVDGHFQSLVFEKLKFRLLCIHSYALNFVSEKPSDPSVRSFVCSSREEMSMPMKDLSAIPKGFKLLRVLDVEPINFNLKLPRDLFQLLHLRFLFVSVEIDVLPSAFSQLLHIQTLVFNTSTRTLEIRANILNLTQLRHFKTKASAALPETTSASSPTTGESIQTLGTISPESCRKDVFKRACNLKKLGVRGNLALLLDGQNESIDSLGKLEHLEKLKLLNDVYPIPPTGLQVLTLPPPHKFPPKLKILTLSRTCLEWCQMPIIASLENLEVLKLEDKAFVGDIWEVSHGGFRRLEVLRIERTNLKIWLVSDNDQFPKLKLLQLRLCDDLQQIPAELASVPSFCELDLFHCKRAAASAKEMDEKIMHSRSRRFSLSIFPRYA